MNKPKDRIKRTGTSQQEPKILASAEIKIPDKEIQIMSPDEAAPGEGTCSCHSVCSCVPVSSCSCHMVCTCDSVCSTNACSCNPVSGCDTYTCTCQPVCSCVGHSCCVGVYFYPS
ncbi:Uncharacterized protein dnl_52100 [Desulfonema limicola]|uniref:Uncharacterized protein n=1 Tax=Desulfonema limicola TaxID=45656 RepID=A0A975BCT6_9BACT|nr:hypothetical protein [Desulfonema limicola]QTA82825.1 Uncharacterized protein dnl_52100 [Desulfonema limicola]